MFLLGHKDLDQQGTPTPLISIGFCFDHGACAAPRCAASHLRSLRRVEMVVRRKPLSRLDSAVAIWYSSFSMEKGLAIRRHLRS